MTMSIVNHGKKWAGMGLLMLFSSAALGFEVLQPLPEKPIIPENNPVTANKVELGKQLFFDPRLSKDGTLSCNSCHNLASGGDDDGAIKALSGGKLKRSAPPVYNAAHLSVAYWDSRASSLEAQVVEHLLDPNTMNMGTAKNVESRVAAIPGYVKAMNKAFQGSDVTIEKIAKAIASFERTLNTPNSAFDRYIKGNKSAISKQAKRGLTLFTDVGCLSCHFGVNFAGPAPGPALKMGDGFYELFPNHLGSHYDKKYDLDKDLGLYNLTLDPGHKHMFRVPPLRNIANTAPYFHNGSVNSLDEAVTIMALVQLKRQLNPQEVKDIVAFLETLTGEYPEITLPRIPELAGKSITTK